MADKVKPLKIENPSTGGDELDFLPTEVNPTEDHLAAKGIALENSDNTTIEGVSGVMKFKDTEVTSQKTLKDAMERIQYKDLDLSSLPNGWVITWDNVNNKFKMLPTGGGGNGVTPPFIFSRSGSNPSGSYLKTGDVITSNTGQLIKGTNTINEISVSTSSAVGSDTVIQIQERTGVSTFSDVTGATVTITTGNYKATNSGLNIAFGSNKEMSVYIQSGSSLQNPVVVVYLLPA